MEGRRGVMKRAMIGILCAALAAPLMCTATARAADPPADGFARQRALFEEGKRLYGEGRWAEARAVFLEIWAMRKSYDVAAYLGDIELMLGQARSAAEYLTYALRTLPVGAKPALRQTLSALFEEARRLVGGVRIQVNKPGAEVFVDGTSVGYAPIGNEVFVEPGEHELTAKREGYADAIARVEARAGAAYEVALTLKPAAIHPAPPKESTAVPPREHEMGTHPGVAPSDVLIGAGIGLTALLAGSGIAFTLLSNSEAADADELAAEIARDGGKSACWSGGVPRCSTLHDMNAQSDTFHSLAVAGFVGAGAAGAATLVYALWPRASTEVRVTPVVGVSAGGVVVGGRF